MAATKDRAAKAPAAGKALTKAEVCDALVQPGDEFSKADVAKLLGRLATLAREQLAGEAGVFVLPSVVKLRRAERPATAEKPGFKPGTREPITIKAKPASRVVKATVLAPLKDLSAG